MKNRISRFAGVFLFTLSLSVSVIKSPSATAQSIYPSKEQPGKGWLVPVNYGSVVGNFDVVVPTNMTVINMTATVGSEYRPLVDFGRLAVFNRPEGDWRSYKLCEPQFPTIDSEDARKGTLVFTNELKLSGTNMVYLVTERLPSSEQTGATVYTKLVMSTASLETKTYAEITGEVTLRVRGLHPVTRIDTRPTAYNDYTLFVEGGQPYQKYDIFSSTNLVDWRHIGEFWNFQGDYSVGGKNRGIEFFKVLPKTEE